MEKLKINYFKADSFVKKGLIFIGYPENIEIISYFGDEGKVCYQAYYEKIYNGETSKYVMPLSRKNYIDLMKLAMSLSGYTVNNINIKNNEDSIYYEAFVDIVSFDNSKRIRGRK